MRNVSIPPASKLMIAAAAALERGDFDEALQLKEQAETVEPRLRREARNAPKTVEELMPLLRRRQEAGPVMRQFRHSLGLTLQQVAEICGVHTSAAGHWETGRSAMSQEAADRLMTWVGERGVREICEGPPPQALL